MNIKSSFFGLENKIISAFLFFSLLMSIIAVSTINTYDTLEKDVWNMNKLIVPETISLKNIELNILLLTLHTCDFLKHNETQSLSDFEKIIMNIKIDIDIYLRPKGSDEKAAIIRRDVNEIINLCINAIDMKNQGEEERILDEKRDEIITKQKQLIFLLNEYNSLHLEKIKHIEEKINRTYNTGKRNILLANLLVLIAAVIAGLLLSRRIIRPVKEMERVARGELKKTIKINTNDEIEDLANSFNGVMRELISSKEKLQNYADTLEKQVDEKTKELKNKVANEERTTKAMMHILIDLGKTNKKLNQKESELEMQTVELGYRTQEAEEKTGMYEIANRQLVDAQKQLKKFNSILRLKVEERTRSLRHEKEKVELLLKEKNDFIIRLSHDLRTPLTPLTTLFSILEVEIKDEKHKKYIRICNENIRYMKNLVLNTLNMARFDTHTVVLKFQQIDIKKLIDEFIEANAIEYKKKNITIVNYIKKLPLVSCDETKIMEVIQNICSNTVKYSPNGGALTFDADVYKKHITIKITDQGMGMEPNVVRNMFVEFYRGDPSRHDLSCGLGMSISKRIIESHNGKIWAKSRGSGKGSTILFTLPIKQKEKH
ncbi:MAG: hypothetical protein DRN66_03095 [Candidatus Nanohalarchaeota archaeon]|nr:MAG: hypothetical protein DRN66_03095 [Candidatus Nanohaloarchaeota archaeon]